MLPISVAIFTASKSRLNSIDSGGKGKSVSLNLIMPWLVGNIAPWSFATSTYTLLFCESVKNAVVGFVDIVTWQLDVSFSITN